jgi:hypothetical protein
MISVKVGRSERRYSPPPLGEPIPDAAKVFGNVEQVARGVTGASRALIIVPPSSMMKTRHPK